MKKLPLLDIASRRDELSKCVNCGLCQAVCPTYLTTGHEGKTARGKIVMINGMLNGSLKPSKQIADLFDDCLTCYACQTVCPSGVRTEKLWTPVRQDLGSKSLLTQIKRVILRWTIGQPVLFNKFIRIIGNVFGFDREVHGSAKLNGRILLPFKGAPYLRELAKIYDPVRDKRGTVALLPGCSANLFTPWVVDAVIKVLNAAGWRVTVPPDQVCCGAPAINNGDWRTAKKLARKNIKIFNGIECDYVTSCDATCAGAFMKDYLELFADDEPFLMEVRKLSSKTRQLGQLLSDDESIERLNLKGIDKKITVHDSCHSTHLVTGSDWRKVLSGIEGLKIVEMRNSNHCCGFGGSYSFAHPASANRIAAAKLANALETGVDEVLTGSPGCTIRLQSDELMKDNSSLNKNSMSIRHVAEFLAELTE